MHISMMQSVDAHRSSGYPSDSLFQGHCRYILLKMYNGLKYCDEKTGKCASNFKSGYGVRIHAHKKYVVCWCPSIVWLSIRHVFPWVPSGFLWFIDENVQQFEVLLWRNWKVCLKFEEWRSSVCPCSSRRCSLLVPINRQAIHQTLFSMGTIRFLVIYWQKCTTVWSAVMRKLGNVPQIWRMEME